MSPTTKSKTSLFASTLLWLAALILAATLGTSQAAQQTLQLTGAMETPPVATKASGEATLNVDDNGIVSGGVKTKDIKGTAAHIHTGAPGMSGPPIITLAEVRQGPVDRSAGFEALVRTARRPEEGKPLHQRAQQGAPGWRDSRPARGAHRSVSQGELRRAIRERGTTAMNRANQGLMTREAVLELAESGHTPRALASRFGVTEWTIRRWISHAQRRRQLPYWQQMPGTSSGSEHRMAH